MSITENDYEQFIGKWNEIANRYSLLLKDKKRFIELSENKDFINENNTMYLDTSKILYPSPKVIDELSSSALSNYLTRFEDFVEKWKTRPVNSWFFDNPIEDLENPGDYKRAMESMFDEYGQFQVIKVYPWTTKKEIKRKFDEIKDGKLWKLQPEQYSTNFKIKALRDVGWRFAEIIKFLGVNDEYESRIIERTQELEKQGRSEGEINRILDEEFPLDEIDSAIDRELNYDAIRKRKKAADDECNKLLKFLKIGK